MKRPRLFRCALILMALDASALVQAGALPTASLFHNCSTFWTSLSEALPRPSDEEMLKREDWFRNSVLNNIDGALRMVTHWTYYRRYGLREGEQIFWMQQRHLKELNEKLWDLGGTEYYLGAFDATLAAHLQAQPELGRLIQRNYKDRVVISSLSRDDFQRLVLEPVKAKLLQKISDLKGDHRFGRLPQLTFKDFIDHSIQLGQGQSLVAASVNLKLSLRGQTLPEWQAEARSLRQQLLARAGQRGLAWESLLTQSKTLKSESEAFQKYLADQGFHPDFHVQWLRYLDLLEVADFLPLNDGLAKEDLQRVRELLKNPGTNAVARAQAIAALPRSAWDVSRGIFLAQAPNAHSILATDIKGLGTKALMARDRWIAEGASLDTLENVYAGTTRELQAEYSEFAEGLTRALALPRPPVSYISGDDGLWALPELNERQQQALQAYLAGHPNLYTHVQRVENVGSEASLARAIYESREKLFAEKAARRR